MTIDADKSYYQILKVSPSARPDAIKAAYKRLSEQLMNYRQYGISEEDANARLAQVNEAHSVLMNPVRRLSYDRELATSTALQNDTRSWVGAVSTASQKVESSGVLSLVNGSLRAVLMLALIFFLGMIFINSRRNSELVSSIEEQQRKKVELEERKRQYGDVTDTEAEAAKQEAERKRKERELLEVERKQAQELKEHRRYAERVSNELQAAKERRQWESERERERNERAELERQREEERRLQRLQNEWHRVLRR